MNTNYKEFGIYVNDYAITVIANIEEDLLLGIDYNLDDYYEN